MLGEVINNYEIKSLLGQGGMGAVYLAEHPFIGRRAAIKILRQELAQDLSLVERFMNEARAANAIRHPNIIDIIDVGRTPSGVPYLMMEFLEGRSLAGRIAAGPLELAEVLEIGVQTSGALAAAHAKGIVHRDLKPDNLFLVPDDSRPGGTKVKVLDFGIAKLRGDLTNASAQTQAGALMGTPPYMSPEQCRGLTDEIDHRTDIYALGIILFEMLCGEPPFVSPGWGDIILAHLSKPPPSPRAKNPRIPAPIEAAILKALAKDKNDRFASMSDLQATLRAAASAAPTAGALPTPAMPKRTQLLVPPPTTTFRTATGEVAAAVEPRPARRGRPALWFAIAGAGAAVIGALVLQGRSGTPPGGTSMSLPKAAVEPTPAVPGPSDPASAGPREAPVRPERPPQIRLRLASEPAGAAVVDARDGTVLGSTPLDRRIDGGAAPLLLRIDKPGFTSAEVRVPRDVDFDTTVRLQADQPHTRAARHRPGGPVGEKVSPGTAVGAPATAAPPVRPAATTDVPAPPPVPARRIERW